MHYILIDYENVQPDIAALACDFEIDLTVFLGPNQRVKPRTDAAIQQMDTRADVIKVSNAGPNALDFHLAFHLGQLVMADPTSTFEIISNDKGYDSLVHQLAAKNVRIQRSPGAHRPEGYTASKPSFTPYYLREQVQASTALPANPQPAPAPLASDPPRDAASLRGAIRTLKRTMRALHQLKHHSVETRHKMDRTAGRINRLQRSLAILLGQDRPDTIAASGRNVLRLPPAPAGKSCKPGQHWNSGSSKSRMERSS